MLRFLVVTFLVAFLCSFKANAHNNDELDLFNQRYRYSNIDDKIALYFEYFPKIERINIDSCLFYINDFQDELIKSPREDVTAFLNFYWSIFLLSKQFHDEAINKIHKALPFFEKEENDTIIANIYTLLGNIYFYKGELVESEKHYLQSIQSGKRSGNIQFEMLGQLGLANVYIKREMLEEASELVENYLIFARDIKSDKKLANAYARKGEVAMSKGDISGAIVAYEKSLHYNLLDGSPSNLANGYTNIAIAHFFQENLEAALGYFHLALTVRKNVGNDFFIAESYHNLGQYFSAIDYKDSAIYYFSAALELGRLIQSKTTQADAIYELADIYGELGDFEKKSILLEEYIKLNNAIFKDKSDADIRTLRLSFASDEKEQLIQSEVREIILKGRVSNAQSIYLAATFLLIALVVLTLLFLFYKRRKNSGINKSVADFDS
ncbi:MAG: tetratricopeptide repeat protein [Crocinitomicaceae bacterium]|nr:tetratricopeptide repeat protein [Crocinitomicaceae bacterium]